MTFKIEYNDLICNTERKKTGVGGVEGCGNLNGASRNCETITKDLTFVSSAS